MAERPLDYILPADLPEDWRESDIVAPHGEIAGMRPQNGYNYQSGQINLAHEAINQLNRAFEGIVEEYHLTDPEAHKELFDAIRALFVDLEAWKQQQKGRIDRLEDALFNDVTGNPFQMAFETLDGLSTTGVWNLNYKRLEC